MRTVDSSQLRTGMKVRLIGTENTALGWRGAEFEIIGFTPLRYVSARCTKLGPNTEDDGADYFPDVGDQYHLGWKNAWGVVGGTFGAWFKNHGGSK